MRKLSPYYPLTDLFWVVLASLTIGFFLFVTYYKFDVVLP